MKDERRSSVWLYAAGILVVIPLGIGTRRFPELLPDVLGKYPGDALWATVVYFCWAIVLRSWSSWRVLGVAVLSSWLVEFSQLYQGGWLVELRDYAVVHLLIGSHFYWPDLIAYVVGAGLGMAIDRVLFRSG